MHNETTAGPCVLFVNGTGDAGDYESVRQWLSKSRFETYEAEDIFDALEEVYDFMGSGMPNVIVVHGTEGWDAFPGMISERVVHFSSGSRKPGCIKDLTQLSDCLERYFPPSPPTKHVSA